ncbi:hypothetical protein [Nocardia inohanensis]|uniref:hypothetical protein n=1 Tax=Nocardia inohanensis TaxID=209246 RepID=UPI000832E305|nr:hypothetical protein [Nocardia inohanensis]
MPKFTVRRIVGAGLIGATGLLVLAVPANAAEPAEATEIALPDTGSAGGRAERPEHGRIVIQDRDGRVEYRDGQLPPGVDAVPAIPITPGQPLPDGVTIIQRDPGVSDAPGAPQITIVRPVR